MIKSNTIHLILLLIGMQNEVVSPKIDRTLIRVGIKPYILLYTPLILLMKANNLMIEQIFIAYSYFIFLNKMTNITLGKTEIKNKIYPLTLLVLITSYSYGIIPRTYTSIGIIYGIKIILALSLKQHEKTSLFEIYNNFIISHILFFITKF